MSFIPLANPLPVTTQSLGDVIDTANSSNTPLGGGLAFTGAWTNVLGYLQLQIMVFADQISAIGGFAVQFSSDGVHMDHQHTYTIDANVGETFQMQCHAQYYRIVYTNGAVAQTAFRMQTILRPAASTGTVLEADEIISGFDDCILTKSILTGQSVLDGKYINAKMTPDGGLVINQDIVIDANNSSIANLASGATFTGVSTSNIAASMLQVFLKTDQNCAVYVDQSQDNVHWDIVDHYDFYASIGNFGINIGAFGAYFRVRVQNIGTATTTYFRLQTIYVPIANQLPRSLSRDGWLQVQVNRTQDGHGFAQSYTPFGEQLTAPSYKLVGSIFPGSTLDTNFWTALAGTGGTVTPVNGLVTMSTGTTSNNATQLNTVASSRYISGYTNKFRAVLTLPDTGTVNNTRRWGAYNATDGSFFELAGTTLNLVTRKAGVETRITNGSFNGNLGNIIALDTSAHNWAVMYTSFTIWWLYDDIVIHTSSFNSSWTSTLNLPVTFENFNTGGSTTNVSMYIFGGVITRMGLANSQPTGRAFTGATTTTLKIGAGNLHAVVLTANAGTSITLYDNTTGAGTILASISPNQVTTLDFKGIGFSTGLTVVSVGVGCSFTVMYE